jgi:hypothetical protein
MAKTVVVRKDTSAAAKKAAKVAKQARNKNKGKLNAKAKREYKHLSPKQKKAHLEKVVWRKAKAHGATDAEADKAVLIYKKRRQHRNAGKHAAEQRRQATSLQKQVRGNIKMKAKKISDSHKKALQKIRTAKVAPAVKSKMRNAEKQRYAAERTQLAKERNKAVKSHASRLTKIKAVAQKHGPIKLSSLISNFSKRTLGQKGKRLKTVSDKPKVAQTKAGGAMKKPTAAKKPRAAKSVGSEVAAIADKAFGVKGKPGRKPKNPTPAADAPVAKTKRAYVRKAKTAETAAKAAPAAKATKGKKNPTTKVATPATEGKPKRAYNKKPKVEAAEAPKAKRAYNKKPKVEAAPAEVKTKRKYTRKAKPEAAPAAEVKTKRKYTRKDKAAAPAAEAPKAKRAYNKKPKADAAPAAKAPAKTGKKAAAKPAAKAPAKTAAKAPAKGGAKAKSGAAIPQKKTAAKPAKSGNKRATLN